MWFVLTSARVVCFRWWWNKTLWSNTWSRRRPWRRQREKRIRGLYPECVERWELYSACSQKYHIGRQKVYTEVFWAIEEAFLTNESMWQHVFEIKNKIEIGTITAQKLGSLFVRKFFFELMLYVSMFWSYGTVTSSQYGHYPLLSPFDFCQTPR